MSDVDGPLVVLDDDPTGTQAMAGVPVLLRLDRETMDQVGTGWPAVHLMTNSRASEPDVAHGIVRDAARTAAEVWPHSEMILRGDSTLRGHVLEEYEALRDVRFPGQDPVLLLAPALPAAGRVTVDGVHLLERDGTRQPLHDTEYARDAAFAYGDARLLAWAEERSQGRFRASEGTEIRLQAIRSGGAEAVARKLADAAARGGPVVCAADAENLDDLRMVADGFFAARRRGVPVVLRCAPTLAGVASGATAQGLAPLPAGGQPVLVVCGSYVPTATRQLQALTTVFPEALVEIDPDRLGDGETAAEVQRLVTAIDARLSSARVAVLATPRPDAGGPGDLARQGLVADAIASAVRSLPSRPPVLLTKGGVTSAVTVRDGLGAARAEVVGPVASGVGLWRVIGDDGRKTACVVVPGNVGDDDLLLELTAGLVAPPPAGGPRVG